MEVIGLGAGDIDQLPLGIYRKLTNTDDVIWVRTKDHPVVKALAAEGVQFHSFDAYYEREDQFESVYESIVKTLLEEARTESLIYAVPGHPMLAERTVELLLHQQDVHIELIGGKSYLDDLFTALQVDPIEGFQFMDGTSFNRGQLNYEQHIIFCQVYDRMIASDIKLALLEDLPADHPITLVEAAGATTETLTTVPLNEMDHSLGISNLRSVYIPPAPAEALTHTFKRLREVIATLRGPNGCDWDKKQTHETLRTYLIEEVYELIDAIDMKDDEGIIEELGDVLLQVMLHSQIGEDAGYFMIDDVIQGITNKMIHRHPHVFGGSSENNGLNWEALKQKEKRGKRTSLLTGVSKSLPGLSRAAQLQAKAIDVGFGWNDVAGVWNKLAEEIEEVKAAMQAEDEGAIEEELGDVLFVIANLSTYYHINPEIALQRTNRKFISRFQFIEKSVAASKREITTVSQAEMDEYWDQAKREED